MSVGGDASVGGGGRAANLEVHLDRFGITFCGNAAGWAGRSHVVSVLRLEGATHANDAMRVCRTRAGAAARQGWGARRF